MTRYRPHSDRAAMLQSKDSYFYAPKYRSSDALPAPENIFAVLVKDLKEKYIQGVQL